MKNTFILDYWQGITNWPLISNFKVGIGLLNNSSIVLDCADNFFFSRSRAYYEI